jgi:hypothetical protein
MPCEGHVFFSQNVWHPSIDALLAASRKQCGEALLFVVVSLIAVADCTRFLPGLLRGSEGLLPSSRDPIRRFLEISDFLQETQTNPGQFVISIDRNSV